VNKQKVFNLINEFQSTIERNSATFRHAAEDFDTIASILNFNVTFDMNNSIKQTLKATVMTGDYTLFLDTIHKHRPRLQTPRIETDGESTIFYLSYDNNWDDEPKKNKPLIIEHK
jgi:hypothetical protein